MAHLAANALDDLGVEQRHCPVAAASRDLMREIAQEVRTLRRMGHFGMEQCPVKPPAVVGNHRKGCGIAGGDRAKPGRKCLDLVAVAHPHLGALALGPQPVEQQAIVENIDKSAAEFLMLAQADTAAQLVAHCLHAVANAEHRHAELEDDVRGAGCATYGHRGRPSRQNDRARREIANLVVADRKGVDLAIDTAFAHPARDQLRHLAAEVEDQDAIGHDGLVGSAAPRPQRAGSPRSRKETGFRSEVLN